MRLTKIVLATLLAGTASGCFSERMSPSSGGQGVEVGNIFFRSNLNGSINPAVDTVAAGTPLQWTWVSTGSVPHSVRSTGSPSFASSAILTGDGMTYAITFTAPGVYQYDCEVHGADMTGRVVVVAPAAAEAR